MSVALTAALFRATRVFRRTSYFWKIATEYMVYGKPEKTVTAKNPIGPVISFHVVYQKLGIGIEINR